MTRDDWITVGVIALGLLILIKFSKLKVWHALLVLGAGFYLAITPAGVYILAEAHRLLASVGH